MSSKGMDDMENVDFRQDLRMWAVNELKKNGVRYKEKDNLQMLLVKLYTFLEKYIAPYKRTVQLSNELEEKLPDLPEDVRDALGKMAQWVCEGVNINYFQGRGLYGGGSRDYQNMLYGIVHLHLSAKKEDASPAVGKDGFAKPGRYVLFACFRGNKAFFIDVAEPPKAFIDGGDIPTQWTSANLLQIMVRNWSELTDNRKIFADALCDANGNEIKLDDKAIAQLTANHINIAIGVNGVQYVPGNGITRNGTSVNALMRANRTIREADAAQKAYENYHDLLYRRAVKLLTALQKPCPKTFLFHFDYVSQLNGFAIVERNSSVIFDYRNARLILI